MINRQESEQRDKLTNYIKEINSEFKQTLSVKFYQSCTKKVDGRFIVVELKLFDIDTSIRTFGTLIECDTYLSTLRLGMVLTKHNFDSRGV